MALKVKAKEQLMKVGLSKHGQPRGTLWHCQDWAPCVFFVANIIILFLSYNRFVRKKAF